MLPFVLLLPPPLPSSSSSGMRNLNGWMMGRMTEWMDGKDDHQGYYISRFAQSVKDYPVHSLPATVNQQPSSTTTTE
jgi:hypothetical protein